MFIKDFDMYLWIDRYCCNNMVWIYMVFLWMMVNVVIDNGWFICDFFWKYEIEKEEMVCIFFNKDEIVCFLDIFMKNVK